jgi:hypothetical protein
MAKATPRRVTMKTKVGSHNQRSDANRESQLSVLTIISLGVLIAAI